MGSYTMTQIKMRDTVLVHKENEEGTIQVRVSDGKIITPLDQRPDWAEGLAVALVQDRLSWYERRLGKESSAFKALEASQEAIEFSDLDFLGVDAEQQELEVYHDPATRSEFVAKALGIDTEVYDEDKGIQGNLAEREVSRETMGMSATEINEMAEAQNKGFVGETVREQTQRERAAR